MHGLPRHPGRVDRFPAFFRQPFEFIQREKIFIPAFRTRLFFPCASTGNSVRTGYRGEAPVPDRSHDGVRLGDEPKGPGPDRGLYAGVKPRAPCGRARTLAGHGKPRHVLIIERCGPVPRFPTLPAIARRESGRGNGEVRAKSPSPPRFARHRAGAATGLARLDPHFVGARKRQTSKAATWQDLSSSPPATRGRGVREADGEGVIALFEPPTLPPR